MADNSVRGLNEAGLEALIQTTVNEARAIRGAVADISRAIDNTWWKGADAERFRKNWSLQHRRDVNRVADELDQLASNLRSQLATQRRLSNR